MRELPFTISPNTHFYCYLQTHEEALQVLLTSLKTGEGFIKVTGEVGTGKTLLCRKLLNELPDQFVAAYLPNSYLSPDALRRAIAAELGVKLPKTAHAQDSYRVIDAIHQRLLAIQRSGQTVVVIIDEAQALPDESLEALRLFSNLETEQSKLVQLVMFGQPELDQRLAQPELRQLRQRIGFAYQLRSLSLEEAGRYIHHRLQIAGYQGGELFPFAVLKRLHQASRGIPRLLNILCHKCLILTYGRGLPQVNRWAVEQAIADTSDVVRRPLWQRWFVPGAMATVALMATLMMFTQGGAL